MAFSKRQIEIIESATKLIGEKGIQNLTTKRLAADMGISEPALYRHFKNKNEILESLLRYYQLKVEASFGTIIANSNPGLNKIEDLVRFQFDHFTENPAVAMVIMAESSFINTETLSQSVCNVVGSKKRLMESVVIIGQGDGTIRKDLSAEQLATLVMGGMRMTVLRWRLSQFSFDLQKAGAELSQTLSTLLQP